MSSSELKTVSRTANDQEPAAHDANRSFALPVGYGANVAPSPSEIFARATQGAGAEVPFRAELEHAFGEDFSSVRAHFGQGEILAPLAAAAATSGEAIAFADSNPGKELVAHELAHVVQRRRHGAGGADERPSPGEAAEREADAVAAQAARGETVKVSAAPRTRVSFHLIRLKKEEAIEHKTTTTKTDRFTREDSIEVDKSLEELEYLQRARPDLKIEVTATKQLSRYKMKIPVGKLDLSTFKEVATQSSGVVVPPLNAPQPPAPAPAAAETVTKPLAGNSKFDNARVTAADQQTMEVSLELDTVSSVDRFEWQCRLKAPNGKTQLLDVPQDNPAWSTATGQPCDLAAQGSGTPGADRTIKFRLNVAEIREFFRSQGSELSVSSIIQFGFRTYYEQGCAATCASAEEYQRAYHVTPSSHTWGVTREPQGLSGLVDLALAKTTLALPDGKRQYPFQYFAMPVPNDPPPFVTDFFPSDYAQKNSKIRKLVPDKAKVEGTWALGGKNQLKSGGLKLESRIESEATLGVSSLEKLHELVVILHWLSTNPGVLSEALKAVSLIESWSMTPLTKDLYLKPGEPNKLHDGGDGPYKADETLMHKAHEMFPQDRNFLQYLQTHPIGDVDTFTDTYLDDKDHKLLNAGVGLRVRSSSKLTKLCVKTGDGVQTNMGAPAPRADEKEKEKEHTGPVPSDIWRRYEIGFEVDKNATPEQIRTFLKAGVDGANREERDPWNTGGEQVEAAVGDKVDWESLNAAMALQGRRHKFELKGKRKGGGGALNIEISCDQTMGRLPPKPGQQLSAPNWSDQRIPQVWNIEMELEHLAPGGTAPPVEDAVPPAAEAAQPQAHEPPHVEAVALPAGPSLLPPMGFPVNRMYQHVDLQAGEDKFNTESFRAFQETQVALVDLLRRHIGDNDKKELRGDATKVRNLYARKNEMK